MIRVLITGAGSYVGESVRKYILAKSKNFEFNAVDTMDDNWKKVDYTKYDVVFHVAGIAHVNADPKMKPSDHRGGKACQDCRREAVHLHVEPDSVSREPELEGRGVDKGN